MTYQTDNTLNQVLPAEQIYEHLQKIFTFPLFETSDILKRFLSFIVKETLEGHANQLKEYTIGVGVLNKSPLFKPQHNAIVRIHAGRLRRALHRFYQEMGENDNIRISIPKGSYVPFFANVNEVSPAGTVCTKEARPVTDTGSPMSKTSFQNSILLAIMPFSYFDKATKPVSFAQALTAQLTTELAQVNEVSVISYYAIRCMSKTISEVKDINNAFGANYVFTGHIQKHKNRFKINVQMFNTLSSELAWSHVYEQDLTDLNLFDMQNKIIKHIISGFAYFLKSRQSVTVSSISAVA